MDNRLVIVDDFYARPDAVRARALASDYANIEPTDYPGFASRLVLEVDALRLSLIHISEPTRPY